MTNDPATFSFHDPNQTELMRQLGLYIVTFSHWMHWLEMEVAGLIDWRDLEVRALIAHQVLPRQERDHFRALPAAEVHSAVLSALNRVPAGKTVSVHEALCDHYGKTYWQPGEEDEARQARHDVWDCVDRRNRILHDSWSPIPADLYPAAGHHLAPVQAARQIRHVDSSAVMTEVTISSLKDASARLRPAFSRLFQTGWLLVDRVPGMYVSTTGA